MAKDDTYFEGVAHAEKYQNGNWIARRLVRNFMNSIKAAVASVSPGSVFEVGCGEGHILGVLEGNGYSLSGCDISDASLSVAKREIEKRGLHIPLENRSVYDLDPVRDRSEVVLCCEVLEHLTDPELALEKLASITEKFLIVSVPREPLWHLMNMARGKYLNALGNTPGHYNHWTRRGFVEFVGSRMEVIEVKSPTPWTLVISKPKQ